jgi:hypothetical protein
MEEVVKKDIISILKKALVILKQGDTAALDALSNHMLHDASIYQDNDSISIAVVIYALAKIMHRKEHHDLRDWGRIHREKINLLSKALNYLENDKIEGYRRAVKEMLKNIGAVDRKLKWYIEDVLEKARIAKGGKLYEHGLSVGKAAELLGISQYELMSYVGKTKIVDIYPEEVVPVTKRIAYAKRLFNVK